MGTVVTDGSMTVLNASSNASSVSPSRLLSTLPAGNYHVWIYGLSASANAYSLTVSSATLCAAASAAGPILVGDSVSGALTNSDCLLPYLLEGRAWELSLAGSTAVRFSVAAVGFSPWIAVTDRELRLLGIGNTTTTGAAAFQGVLGAGDHFVWVTSFDGGYGEFVLRREAPGSGPGGTPSALIDARTTLPEPHGTPDLRSR